MKILILSCSTGGGHNSAAQALKEQFEKRGVSCMLADMHALVDKRRTKRVSAIYTFFAVRASALFGAAYAIAGLISHPKGHSPVYLANMKYAKAIRKLDRIENFDAIVCTHLFPAEAVTRLRRKYGFDKGFYFVATDYTCSPFNEETKPDYFFIPHADLSGEYRGTAPDRRIPLGIPVSERFLPSDKIEAKKELKIPLDKDHILIMCGSMGFGKVEKILNVLIDELGSSCVYTVLGGNNETLKQSLKKQYGNIVHVVDFTNRADVYMHSADIVFTKPGGLSTTEAAVAGIPIVHTEPIPGCETKNARFFAGRGMSVLYRKRKDVRKALALLHDRQTRDEMIHAQEQQINRNAAGDICDFIMQDIA